MAILAGETLEEFSKFVENVGLYPTIAAASIAVFILAYLIRAVENYVRHLHRKSYLPYSSPRFILTAVGCALVVDGFLVNLPFQERLSLHVGTVTTSAGLLCLITSDILSIVPHIRQMRRVGRRPAGGAAPPTDYDDRSEPPRSDD
jgi:hypothetical protein